MKNIINQLVEMIKEAKDNSEESLSDKKHLSTLHDCYYQGWVEALDFVQTSIDGLLLDKPERRKSDRRVKRLSLPFKDRRNVVVLDRRVEEHDVYKDRRSYDPLKVSEETQSALNKIADASLRGSYPKSLNGLFSYATVIGCDVLNTEDGDIEVYEVSLKYGRQDDCYNETYEDVIFVRKDNLIPVVGVDPVVK